MKWVRPCASSLHTPSAFIYYVRSTGTDWNSPVLESETTAHDGITGDEDESPADQSTFRPREPRHVEEETNSHSAEHLSGPVEGRVERSGPKSECETIDHVLLIRVEPIGSEAHWDEEEDPPVVLERDEMSDLSSEHHDELSHEITFEGGLVGDRRSSRTV